jgi:multidrug efflux pump subunit AcrB
MFHLAIKHGVVLSVAVLIVCLFGVLAVFRVPVQMIPDLDARTVTVRTSWPGASPQDVEKEIIVEQEQYLRALPNLERMIATARTGSASIELEFPHGVDIDAVLIRVNNALAQVPDYPENVDQPRIVTSSFSDNPFLFFRIQPLPGNPARVDMALMHDFIDERVRTRVERVAGVLQVELWGGTRRQVKIYVDPVRLAERRISIVELRDAIRGRNRDVSGGDVDAGKRRYLLRTIGRFDTIEAIEAMIIARRGGASVRLRDVGYAELDHFEVRVKSFANGRPNITMGVRRQVGANVIEVMEGVMAEVRALNDGLLKEHGLRIELTSEDVQYVKDAVAVVAQNLLIGAVLATLVLYLFLRSLPATLIGAVGIPVCTIAAFLGLLLTGRTINVISLAGVAFSIGMTLDNSIVVLENIHRHRLMGKAGMQAALDGVREVWTALLASTLTTVFVFIPLIFIKEEAGQLYSDIAIAISASIIMSMLVAVTVVPAACIRFLDRAKPLSPGRSGMLLWGSVWGRSVMRLVEWQMCGVRRRIVLIGAALAVTAGIIVGMTPKAEYLPEGEESKTFAFLFAPPGYNLETMSAIADELHDFVLPHLDDEPGLFEQVRADVPALNFVVTYVRANSVLMIIETKDRDQIDDLIDVLSRKFREYPGMISFASRGSIFASNLGGTRSINLDISGPELAPLFDAGLQAFRRAKTVFDNPQVRPQPSNLTMGQPLLEIRPDWERAAELGFDASELGYTVWALADGAFVDDYFLDDEKIDMFLYGTQGAIDNPQDIEHLLIFSPNGGVVPLSSVATVRETVNTETIRRVDGERTITLSIVPPRDIPLESAIETVHEQIVLGLRESGSIAESIKMRINGASDRLRATRDALGANFLVAVLIAYLLLVAIFSHWGYPLLIMTSVPLGISGGIVGLWLFNLVGGQLHLLGLADIQQPFDVITMLGFLILIGTVVNNPILLVEQALTNIREHSMAWREAVGESTRSRLRPIVMSSMTTVLGLSPLVFLPGAGTELYRGLGTIVLFGILFSTLITLTFMPALLSLVLQFGDRRRKQPSVIRPSDNK